MEETDRARLGTIEGKLLQLAAQNEFLNETMGRILNKLETAEELVAPVVESPDEDEDALEYDSPAEPSAAVTKSARKTIKPSPPAEFSGDRTKGRAFLNSCDLYLHLAPHQFESEKAKVAWAYSYMRAGRAALFVDRVLRYEARTKKPQYPTWVSFRAAFVEEFFPKNERQRALTRLETSAYHQNRRSMDEYINEFHDLIDLAGYTEGLAIVMKFHKGLRHDIQDQIAQLAHGRPSDSDPSGWYEAALSCAENAEANALFHGTARAPAAVSAFRGFAPVPATPPTNFRPPTSTPPQAPAPQNPVPMDIDAAR